MNIIKTFKESPEKFQLVTARNLAMILTPIFKYNKHRWATHNEFNPKETEIPSKERIFRSIEYMIKERCCSGGINFLFPEWYSSKGEIVKTFIHYRDKINKQDLLFILTTENKHAIYRRKQKERGLCVSCTRKRINATYCEFHAAKKSTAALIKSGRVVKTYNTKFGLKGNVISITSIPKKERKSK